MGQPRLQSSTLSGCTDGTGSPGPESDARKRMTSEMKGTAESAADRLKRPSWKDPRLLVGIVIVLASVAGVVALVSAQDRTTPVYAAAHTLSVGESVDEEDLRVVNVQIDEVRDDYLLADEELPAEQQFVSVVEEGELVPRRSVDDADPQGRQALTLMVEHPLAQAVETGRQVDVWAATPGRMAGDEATVEQLTAGAEVSEISESSSTFGAQSALEVEVLVDPEQVPAILAAGSSQAVVSVLPAGSPEPEAEAMVEGGSEGDSEGDSEEGSGGSGESGGGSGGEGSE